MELALLPLQAHVFPTDLVISLSYTKFCVFSLLSSSAVGMLFALATSTIQERAVTQPEKTQLESRFARPNSRLNEGFQLAN